MAMLLFVAAAKLGAPKPVAFSVPTGNFGDIFIDYVAAQMGLPVAQLMITANMNDVFKARTLASGVYETDKVIAALKARAWTFSVEQF